MLSGAYIIENGDEARAAYAINSDGTMVPSSKMALLAQLASKETASIDRLSLELASIDDFWSNIAINND